MFVELIELLRCPNAHEQSPLIAAARRTDARHIMDGMLGCPLCRAEFPIENGVARFVPGDHPPRVSPVPVAERASAEEATRLAAFLELTDARGFALLAGRWAVLADRVGRISETPLVLVNPVNPGAADVAGTIIVGDVLPFAPGSARAAALDGSEGEALTSSVVRALRDTARVLGPVTRALPHGLSELARDDRSWVAEKNAAPDSAPRLTSLARHRRA